MAIGKTGGDESFEKKAAGEAGVERKE